MYIYIYRYVYVCICYIGLACTASSPSPMQASHIIPHARIFKWLMYELSNAFYISKVETADVRSKELVKWLMYELSNAV
jgi:hypothetical protein